MSLLMMSLFILFMSLNFTSMKHPLAMGLTLLTQTILICGVSGLSSKSMWFAYILFLIFLGAMLVLFVYVASLASNEPFKISATGLMLASGFTSVWPVLMFMDKTSLPIKLTVSGSYFLTGIPSDSTEMIINTIYTTCWSSLTAFMILYLLLTLIVVVKITSTFFGPLRLA